MNDTIEIERARSFLRVEKGLLFAAFFLISLVGCAFNPPVTLSPRQIEAIRHNQSGVNAEAKGDSPLALEEFSMALRIYSSIENSEGIIVGLVNCSRVQRHNGDAKAALRMISKAIPLVTPVSPLYSEVYFEVAQVKLLSGELTEASEWASKAAGVEHDTKRGMRINLLARIHFLRGNLAEAELLVRKALLLNKEHELHHEEANSLRLLGDILVIGQRHAEASDSYTQALAIDKVLGKSRKIAADLRGLAQIAQTRNSLDEALAYYQRAFVVSSSDGDCPGAADDLLKMSGIHEKRGEKEQSERVLADRDTVLKSHCIP
jgi:tetratricopeptide (TPR) repeat protein